MSKHEPGANRHHLRVWLKWAIESGLLDKVPPQYHPDDSHDAQPTDRYARQLLPELKDPDSSKRLLNQILADVRRFRDWVEFRQKLSRRIILTGGQTDGAEAAVLERRASTRIHREKSARRIEPADTNPKSNPMWDDWIDG